MKKIILLILALSAPPLLNAQTTSEKLNSLIENEQRFAALANETTSRIAFLQFCDEKTILFTGTGITNGKKYWEEKKEDSTLFTWYPTYAGISIAGDLGFTAGPAAFYPTRKKDEKPFHGSYITLWKNLNRKWTMALDIGVYPQPVPDHDPKKLNSLEISGKTVKENLSEKKMLASENDFLKTELTNKLRFVSPNAHFYRIQSKVLTQSDQISNQLDKEIHNVEYTQAGYAISESGDLAYVYGKANIKEGDKITPGYYVRIWKSVPEWKIVLDVLTD